MRASLVLGMVAALAAQVSGHNAGEDDQALCRMANHLEGTVLLDNAKCCDGTIINVGASCNDDPLNDELTYAESVQHVLVECDTYRPNAVIIARTPVDVAVAIRFLKSKGTAFRVRSGGHSQSCASACNNCVVISLEAMKTIEYIQPDGDQGPTYMAVEPGNTLLDLFENYLANTNVYFPHGQSAPVSLGGHLGGGAVGLLTRKFGLGTDFIVGVQIVLASGRVLEVFDDEHEIALAGRRRSYNKESQDLLWAIRGNGHTSVGVITKYWMRTITRPKYIVFGYYQYSVQSTDDARNFWNAACLYYAPEHDTPKSRNLVAWPFIRTDRGSFMHMTLFYVPDNNVTAAGALAEGASEIERFLAPVSAQLIYNVLTVLPEQNQLLDLASTRISYTCTSRLVWKHADVCDDTLWREAFATRIFEEFQNTSVPGDQTFFTYFDPWAGAARENDPFYRRTSFMGRHAWGTFVYCRQPMGEGVSYESLYEYVDHFNATFMANISNAWYNNFQDRTATLREHIYPIDSVYQKLKAIKQKYDAHNLFHDRLSVELPLPRQW